MGAHPVGHNCFPRCVVAVRTEAVAMHEARQHERKALSLRPMYRLESWPEYAETACVDLSHGGMFIESPIPAEPGTLVKVECRNQHGLLRGLGQVVWRRSGDATTSPGMGIRFMKLDSDARNIVDGLIAGARLSDCLLYTSPSPRD